MSTLHSNMGEGFPTRGLSRSLLESVSIIYEMTGKNVSPTIYLIIVEFRAHWQLIILCLGNDVGIWFCSLRKKLDIHIKAAVSKLCFLL